MPLSPCIIVEIISFVSFVDLNLSSLHRWLQFAYYFYTRFSDFICIITHYAVQNLYDFLQTKQSFFSFIVTYWISFFHSQIEFSLVIAYFGLCLILALIALSWFSLSHSLYHCLIMAFTAYLGDHSWQIVLRLWENMSSMPLFNRGISLQVPLCMLEIDIIITSFDHGTWFFITDLYIGTQYLLLLLLYLPRSGT